MTLFNTPQSEPGTSNLVDTRPQGAGQEIRAIGQKYILSVTQAAEVSLGDVSKWREVLAANPSQLPFKLPPTLQTDIDKLNNTIAFTGLKIPSLDSLENELKTALVGLVNPVLSDLESKVKIEIKKDLDLLKQIDWLLLLVVYSNTV
jgi:hypothetical protein